MTELVIPITLMRGGTSKGVFIHASELPPAGAGRDDFLLALMGSPDSMQIDGLGGTHSSTSKVMAVSPSADSDADIDYLFAQVGIDEAVVDYQGNCGNLTTAIAPFAIDEGLVAIDTGAACVSVTLRNLNTGVRVRAEVPVEAGRAATEGTLAIAGVPGTGPAIVTDYLCPGGSVLNAVLPTGKPVDHLSFGTADSIEASIVDVTSPHAFVRRSDVDTDDLERLERIRATCGASVGLDSPAIPRLVIAGPSSDEGADIEAQAVSMQRLHHAFPMTGALCLAAAVQIEGTIANEAAAGSPGSRSSSGATRLRHPKGIIELRANVEGHDVRSVGATRTARRLLKGDAYVVMS